MTGLTFAEAMNAYRASLVVYEATDFDSMGVAQENEISNAHWETADVVLQAPARTGEDLLEKMSMIDARYMVDSEAIPKVDWEALLRDVISLIRPAAADDHETLAAWSRFSSDAWRYRGDRPSTEQSRKDENLLALGTPSAPRAIAAKLRYALYNSTPVPWLEAAALGAVIPQVSVAIDMDVIQETIWSAIQSLEAMGGGV